MYWGYLWTPRKTLAKFGYSTLILGAAIHSVFLIYILINKHPIASGLERSLSLFALLIAIVFIIYEARLKISVLGALVSPLVFLLTLPSIIIPKGIIEPTSGAENPWIITHIALVFTGEAIFTVAFVAGVLYLYEEHRLKSKRMGKVLMKLPSLTKLDRLNHICLLAGFPILTLGLAIGFISAKQIWGVFWQWDYKGVWALATWVLFGALINLRLLFGWKGRRAAIGAILGFLVILITLFTIGLLHRGT